MEDTMRKEKKKKRKTTTNQNTLTKNQTLWGAPSTPQNKTEKYN